SAAGRGNRQRERNDLSGAYARALIGKEHAEHDVQKNRHVAARAARHRDELKQHAAYEKRYYKAGDQSECAARDFIGSEPLYGALDGVEFRLENALRDRREK